MPDITRRERRCGNMTASSAISISSGINDEPPLRRNVQLALNRGENYHKLRRAVAYANFGKLRFKTEQEQQIWQECSRLITNCIIYYNATILSALLTYQQDDSQNEERRFPLNKTSPVAWQHINLHGRYEFTKNSDPLDMQELIQAFAQRAAKGFQAA